MGTPYHCHYNPVELVRSQVKLYVAEKNSTFRIADVERVTHEAIDSITTSAWAGCVRHAERLQKEDFNRETRRDSVMDPLIITLHGWIHPNQTPKVMAVSYTHLDVYKRQLINN